MSANGHWLDRTASLPLAAAAAAAAWWRNLSQVSIMAHNGHWSDPASDHKGSLTGSSQKATILFYLVRFLIAFFMGITCGFFIPWKEIIHPQQVS
jgi:hypothetical protein